jgi:hypothetical protein
MTHSSELEVRYRRLMAWYPRSFRRQHEQEVLSVLMSTAGDGQRRPGVAASLDLARGGMRMRMRPGTPRSQRSVFTAVRLMYVGAVLELVTWITILATAGAVRAAVMSGNPGYPAAQAEAALRAHVLPDEIAAPIIVGLWLWMAWANGRGHNWARIGFAVFFGASTVGVMSGLANGGASYATADLVLGIVLWTLELAILLLIYHPRSAAYYRRATVVSG